MNTKHEGTSKLWLIRLGFVCSRVCRTPWLGLVDLGMIACLLLVDVYLCHLLLRVLLWIAVSFVFSSCSSQPVPRVMVYIGRCAFSTFVAWFV